VPSWFLSLILTCYAIAAVVRGLPRRRTVLAALLVVASPSCAAGADDFTRQILAFVGGMSLRRSRAGAVGPVRAGFVSCWLGVPGSSGLRVRRVGVWRP